MRQVLQFFAPPPARPMIADAAAVHALFRRKRRAIFLAITLGYAFQYTLRLGLSVVKKPLIDQGAFTVEQFGLFGSALFYSYAFGKLINGCIAYGFISDKLFDARRPPVNLIFGIVEVAAIATFYLAPPHSPWIVGTALVLYGFTLSGLVASLGGLFATDIASKKATGATMGFIGVFSYLAAGAQEHVSAYLIEREMTWVDGVRHYHFGPAIAFWIGGSVLSLVLASTLWRTRAAD